MATTTTKTLTKPEKIKPKPSLQRRNSIGGGATSIFTEPIPIPNYLRASIGSCHDLCKYGARFVDSAPEEPDRCRMNMNVMKPAESKSKSTNSMNIKPAEPKSKTTNSMKMKPAEQNSRTTSSMNMKAEVRAKKVLETKDVARKLPNEASKITCNARDQVKKPISQPRTTSHVKESSPKIPTPTIRRTKSVPRNIPKSQPKKRLESSVTKSQRPKKPLESSSQTQCEESAAEKIIEAVNDDGKQQNEDLVPSPDHQNQEILDSATNDSSTRKLEMESEEDAEKEKEEIEEEDEDDWKERRLRRVVSDGDFENKKKEPMTKDKVRALVLAFENLVGTPD